MQFSKFNQVCISYIQYKTQWTSERKMKKCHFVHVELPTDTCRIIYYLDTCRIIYR